MNDSKYEIELPDDFQECIKKSKFEAPLKSFLRSVRPLIDRSPTLFPEYTDHSSQHVQAVINSSAEIIDKASYKIITPEDIYTLCLAACLHDYAMTFSWDDLCILVNSNKYNQALYGYVKNNEPSWSHLWESYKAEFDNFDLSEINDIVGEKLEQKSKFDYPFPDIHGNGDLQKSQLKIAGEFVRRHHARIAQCIATFGFPAESELEIFDSDYDHFNRMSGFVARSHHESMRKMHDRLNQSHKINYYNCHPVFLMAVLRIADLMQITTKRTPAVIFKATQYWSGISVSEWKKHLSILDFHNEGSDPSCLSFQIEPSIKSVDTLKAITDLIIYFQDELDKVWATLGETYASSRLSDLKLTIRRVTSDIEDVSFLQSLPFEDVPGRFKVDLSLIDKLKAPLYGNRPEVGVRELIQNSLDSTRERKALVGGDEKFVVKVYLSSKEDKHEFKIVDEGCGMDGDLIRNHFLCIGSSYRGSKEWRSNFNTSGQSKVNRSGRFGIGVLAGYILGDEIKVNTKRIYKNKDVAKYGLNFSMRLHESNIQFNKILDPDYPIGTTISISLSREIYVLLRNNPHLWHWYYNFDNDYQEVERFLDGIKIDDQPLNLLKADFEELSYDKVGVNDFKWSLTKDFQQYVNVLLVNSLKIANSGNETTSYPDSLDSNDEVQKYWTYDILYPLISLNDSNLVLPLNLERGGFSEMKVPFGPSLYEDVVNKYLKGLAEFDKEIISYENDRRTLRELFFGIRKSKAATQQLRNLSISLWAAIKNGYIFSDLHLFKKAGIERIYLVGSSVNSLKLSEGMNENSALFKFENEWPSNDIYNDGGLIHCREQDIFQHLSNGAFLRHMFDINIKLNGGPNFGILLNKIAYERIRHLIERIPNLKALFLPSGSNYYISNKELMHYPFEKTVLQGREFIIDIDLGNVVLNKEQNLLVKKWCNELTLPYLCKETKLVKHIN